MYKMILKRQQSNTQDISYVHVHVAKNNQTHHHHHYCCSVVVIIIIIIPLHTHTWFFPMLGCHPGMQFFFVMYELNLKQIVSTMQSMTVKWLVSYILWLNSSNSLHSSHQLLNVCILGYFHTNLWSSYGENFTFKFLHVCTFYIHARLIIIGS